MPVIKAFKALRANDKNIKTFPSKTVDNYSESEIAEKVDSIYDSIFQIIEPTFRQNESNRENYQEVRKNFEEFMENERLNEDKGVAFYVYQQKGRDFSHRGIIGLFDLRDVENGSIRLHENTLKKREELFATYLEEVEIQSEPVLMTYPTNQKMELFIQNAMKSKPILNYEDEEGTQHTVWRVDNRSNMKNIIDAFGQMEAIYLADGHHRLSSSAQYMQYKKAKDKEYIGNEPYHYVLGYAVGDRDLHIHEYNRLVKDLGDLSKTQFLEKLSQNFKVVEKGEQVYFPSHKHHISMYMDGNFYGLYIDHSLRGKPEGLGELDTYLFERLVSEPILNIEDSTSDNRVDFIKGTGDKRGIEAMKQAVDSGKYRVGFGFYPIRFPDMKLVSDLTLKMPPKSTYIRPKLLTGLLMFNMGR